MAETENVHNIRVVVRFRPTNERERQETKHQTRQSQDTITYTHNNKTNSDSVQLLSLKTHDFLRFDFDSILKSDASQEKIFERVALQNCQDILMGFNSTIFAYGQTSSGKTYT